MTKIIRALYNRIFHKKEVDMLLESIHITPTTVDATFSTAAFADVAVIFTQTFQESKAANYLELTIADVAAMERYVVTVRKLHGKAPSEVADIYSAALKKIVEQADVHRIPSDDFDGYYAAAKIIDLQYMAREALQKVDGTTK